MQFELVNAEALGFKPAAFAAIVERGAGSMASSGFSAGMTRPKQRPLRRRRGWLRDRQRSAATTRAPAAAARNTRNGGNSVRRGVHPAVSSVNTRAAPLPESLSSIDTHSSIHYQVGMKTFSRLVLVSTLFASSDGLRCADAPATFKVSEFTFSRPANWEWVESASPMRKAELKVVDEKTKAKAEE